ncbi:MAG: ABC transporter ATP-binding protein, partial [Alistipes sp.]|nr:ABC transporter ATP-binding protein [Alistipes sp.]
QRIAIARALLRDRSVMLMDEPTAALDTATEALLLQRLSSYASGRTMIIVTHHPSAAELCDAVVRVE